MPIILAWLNVEEFETDVIKELEKKKRKGSLAIRAFELVLKRRCVFNPK